MRAAIAIGLLVAAARVAGGQTPKPPGATIPTQAFEVASVRANTKGPTSYSYTWLPGGRFRAVNLSLRMLVHVAYDLRSDEQLMEAPGWITSERFDIEAIPAMQVDRPQERLMMLQALLRDRFGLVVRGQSVDVPVYALVRTRPDAPLPRALRESVPCPTLRWDPLSGASVGRPAGERDCGAALDRDGGRITGTGASIASLTAVVRRMLDRRVVDRTGLTGRYDFELTWSPDPLAVGGIAAANASLFSAIQELGLQLQPVLVPGDGYVIERIERPTPN